MRGEPEFREIINNIKSKNVDSFCGYICTLSEDEGCIFVSDVITGIKFSVKPVKDLSIEERLFYKACRSMLS